MEEIKAVVGANWWNTQFTIVDMDLVRSFYASIITISRFDIMYNLCA